MNTYQSTPDFYRDYIQHFNKNHDPKNGQFASGHGGSVSINKKEKTKSNDVSSTEKKQVNNKELKKLYKNPQAKSQKIIDDINDNPEYKKAYNNYVESSKKYSEEFNNKLKDPKIVKRAEEEYKKLRKTDKVDKKDPVYDYTLRDVASGDYDQDPRYDKKIIEEATKAFKKDYGKDEDPSNNKYFDYYIEDAVSKTNWKPKKVKSEVEKSFDKSVDNLTKVQYKVVNDYLGSYANQQIGKSTRTYSDVVNSMILNDRLEKRRK